MYLCLECKIDLPTADDAIEHMKTTNHGFKRIKQKPERSKIEEL